MAGRSQDDLRVDAHYLFESGHLSRDEYEVVVERITASRQLEEMAAPVGPAASLPAPDPVRHPTGGHVPRTGPATSSIPGEPRSQPRAKAKAKAWMALALALMVVGAVVVVLVTRGDSSPSKEVSVGTRELRADEDLISSARVAFTDDSSVDGSADTVEITVEEYDVTGLDDLEQYLDDLGFPNSVYLRMGKTRALDGTQRAETSNVDITWTFHPDDGLQVVIGQKNPAR